MSFDAPKIGIKISPLRHSASMILLEQQSESMQALMFQRKSGISFANAVVFPGGVCDKEDQEFLIAATNQQFGSQFSNYSKITAIRELLEQTGILLLPKKNPKLLSEIKSRVVKPLHLTYRQICTLWKQDLDLIVPLLRFLTIQGVKGKRFDCIFYTPHPDVIRVNLNRPENIYDLKSLRISGEGVSYFWKQPREILSLFREQKLLLIPPQIIILSCLQNVSSPSQLKALSPEACVEPIFLYSEDFQELSLLGDKNYPFERLLEKEPESQSKTEFKEFVEQFYRKLKSNQQSSWTRKLSINLEKKEVQFMGTFKEKNLLYFLQMKDLLNSKL